MGIESFLRQGAMGVEWNREGGIGFRALADKFIEEGKAGLRDISREVDVTYKFAPPERKKEVIMSRGRRDAAAIVFGETNFVLEQTAVNRTFDMGVYVSSINNAFVGTLYPGFEMNKLPQEEQILPNQARGMLDVLIKDQNPSNMLAAENRGVLLPVSMYAFLESNGFFSNFDIFVPKFQSILKASAAKPQ